VNSDKKSIHYFIDFNKSFIFPEKSQTIRKTINGRGICFFISLNFLNLKGAPRQIVNELS